MTSFRTLFSHEPLPSISALHLQGAFTPKPRHGAQSPNCQCSSPSYIEQTVARRLEDIASSLAIDGNKRISVEAINNGRDVTKVRILIPCSLKSRMLFDRLKRREYSPRDFMCCDNPNNVTCDRCGSKYAGKPLQITHVSPVTSVDNEDVRWERAAPPKFQRIINADDIDERRSKTRFVYLENVDGWDIDVSKDIDISMNDGWNDIDDMIQCIHSVFCGNSGPLDTLMSKRYCDNKAALYNQLTPSDILDDLRQSFQDGLRQSISVCDSSSIGVELFMKSDTSQKKIKGSSQCGVYNHFHLGMRSHEDAVSLLRVWQGKPMELHCKLPVTFMSLFKINTPATPNVKITMKKLFLDFADAISSKRNRNILSSNPNNHQNPMDGLPSRPECTSTTSHVDVPGLHLLCNYISVEEEQVMMAVLTGPDAPWAPAQHTPSGGQIKRRVQHYGYVFDYESADVLRRDGNGKSDRASRCPPLPAIELKASEVLENNDIENWITIQVREMRGWETMAGVIERTRRIDFSEYFEKEALKNKDILSLDKEVEALLLKTEHNQAKAVDTPTKNKQDTNHQPLPRPSSFPDINQLTINEYTPGQGIGSHIDTETAFSDGLLIITLNGGIVMEFRKIGHDIKKLVHLPPRSLVLLSGDARYKWEHMIVSRTTDTVDGDVIPRKLRVSLTLRTALTASVKGKIPQPLPRFESSIFPPFWGQSVGTELIDNKTSIIEESDLITPSTESKHVHAVYDAIATQWHHTRGKRGVLWPGASQFLANLPEGSIVADVGCGDGKYFSAILGANSYVIGTDISEALLHTASSAEKSEDNKIIKKVEGPQYQLLSDDKDALSLNPAVAVADCIHLPIRSGSCDAAICIAVMHHLSTKGRRIRCLVELSRVVKVGGLINVQAWALEQEENSKRKFHGADVLVPFNAQPKYLHASIPKVEADSTCNGKGVAQMLSESYDGADFDNKKNLVIFQRYCHMYRSGELEELVAQIPTLQLIESAYEKGNHVVLLKVCEPILR